MEDSDRRNEVETASSQIKEVDLNLIEVCKSICKIIYKNKFGTGFFIKLYKNEKELLCLMTNEHVIEKDMIESKEIIDVKYNCEKKWIKIKLDEKERFIKYDKEMDFTIIEMKADDKIKDKYFLLPNINNLDYINKEIYIVQFPEGKNLSHSDGKIKDIIDFELIYDASTKSGSSGSPILLKNTTEVIGIHKQGSNKKKENYGTLICSIIQSLNDDKSDKKKIIEENNSNYIPEKKMTENELKIAKQNGFIFSGKIGVGKSTLINVLFNREVAKTGGYDIPCCLENKVYYLKLKSGKYISLIEMIGLDDNPGKNSLIFKDVLRIISKKKINIKGIVHLINFQYERFDKLEQDALSMWNNIFPSKNFWKHIIIISTRYFGEELEDERKIKNEYYKIIFCELMEKLKNVSNVIDFKELKIKYYNSFRITKNTTNKEKIQNNKNKEDLEILLDDFCKKEPILLNKSNGY